MDSNLITQNKGACAEHFAIGALLSLGYSVYHNSSSIGSNDIICEKYNKTYRVQVKSFFDHKSIRGKRKYEYVCRIAILMGNSTKINQGLKTITHFNYDIDMMLIVDTQTAEVFVVPQNKMSQTQISKSSLRDSRIFPI